MNTLPFSYMAAPVAQHAFRLDLITCSVGCAVWLERCLPVNQKHFDGVWVVTDSKDVATQEAAARLGAQVVVTDVFYEGGRTFDKGGAYSHAFRQLRDPGFVLYMDCDIVLPGDFRARLNEHGLRPDLFYGCRREHVIDEVERVRCLQGEPFQSLPTGAPDWGFGFFQLFHAHNPHIAGRAQVYPSANSDGLSDYLFRAQFGSGHYYDGTLWHWNPEYQVRLPWACYHLGTDGKQSLTRGTRTY